MEEKKGLSNWLEKNTKLALICALILGLILGVAGMCIYNGGTKVARVIVKI